MKNRETFINKVKKVYKQHTNAIGITVMILITIILFVSGYLVSWNMILKPLNDKQFETCEKVAYNVYTKKGTIPEGFSVDMTSTSIKVRYADGLLRGKVTAKLQNNELVMKRNKQIVESIFACFLIATLFVIVTGLVIIAILSIYEKIFKKNIF